MKKWFLTLTAAGLFTMPALAADAQMLKHTAIVINGEMQAERSVGHIFEENNIAMLPVRSGDYAIHMAKSFHILS